MTKYNNMMEFKKKEIYGPTKKVILFTNARNEKHIREWAAHHLLIGFDQIVIFDHKSNPPLQTYLTNFDPRVQVIKCTWENPVKIPLMKKAAQMATQMQADWMLYLDADEFLVINKFAGVKHMLSFYHQAHSLSVNWLMFGTNNHIAEPYGYIIENYTKSCINVDQHVKTFVRPKEIKRVVSAHYFLIFQPGKMIGLDGKLMERSNQGYAFHPLNITYRQSQAYIAHYVYQSEETYLKRKINLQGDDGSFRQRDPEIHRLYNDCENTSIRNKYLPTIKSMLLYFS